MSNYYGGGESQQQYYRSGRAALLDREDYHDVLNEEDDQGVLSWIWWAIKGFFTVLGCIIIITIIAALVLGMPIYSIYLFFHIQLPWMISALMSAGLPYSLALFVVLLYTLGFAAILFTVISLAIRALTDSQPMEGNESGTFLTKFLAFFERRKNLGKFLFGVAFANFVLSGFGLVGAGVGIYLSLVIIPSVVTAMVAATGAPIVLAVIAGICMAFDLIVLTGMFFMTPTWVAWRLVALPRFKDIQENPMQILALVGMVSGLAFGGYLASLVYPILFTALAGLGLPQATVVLAALIISLEVIFATSFVFFMGATGFTHLFSFTPGSSKGEEISVGRVDGNQHRMQQVPSSSLLLNRNATPPHDVASQTRIVQDPPAYSSADEQGFKAFSGTSYKLGNDFSHS